MFKSNNLLDGKNAVCKIHNINKMVFLSGCLAASQSIADVNKIDLNPQKIGEKIPIHTYTIHTYNRSDRNKNSVNSVNKKVSKIDAHLKNLSLTQEYLDVIIVLSNQPQKKSINAIKSRYEKSLNNQSGVVKNILSNYIPDKSMENKKDEISHSKLMEQYLGKNDRSAINKANRDRDAILSNMRDEINALNHNSVTNSQNNIEKELARLGIKINSRTTILNTVSAQIPSNLLDAISNITGVAEIFHNSPGKPELDNQAVSLGVNSWWNNGFDGGVWDVGVLDNGVLETHAALSDHNIIENYSDNGNHGTGIACMYASTDLTNRGLAFGLDKILVDDAGDVAISMEGADWMIRSATDDPEVINYSWGHGDASDNDWHGFSRFVDAVVGNYNTAWAKSAGNSGYATDPTITVPGNNYNGITVANMDDANTVSRSDDVIYFTSSRGPTKDGRKKPDLSAPGQYTMTCNNSGDFSTLGGTSSAAPKVGAASLLLNDGGNWDPKAVKAVLINTADSWEDNNTETTSDDGPIVGKEWNRTYGWGYLDLGHAYFHRNDFFISSVQPRGQSGDFKLYKGQVYNGDKATLVWERDTDYQIDDNGNASTPLSFRNLSDLDLRMYNENTNAGIDADISVRDNVHQVAANGSASAVVKVYAFSSSFDGVDNESYALATEENFSQVQGPDLNVTLIAPASVPMNQLFIIDALVSNIGDLDAHNNSVTLNLPPGYTLVSNARTQSVTKIPNGSGVTTIRWIVRAPFSLGSGSFSVSATNYSYGETFRDSSNTTQIRTTFF